MAATDYSSLYKLCEHPDIVDIVAVQSLLSSSSPSTRTQLISYQNEDGRTPLYAACQSGHNQAVELLLAAGVNKETLNYSRKKPIDVAGTGWGVKEENKQKVIKLLSSPLLPSRVSQIQSRIAQIRQRLNAKSSLPSPSPSPSPV